VTHALRAPRFSSLSRPGLSLIVGGFLVGIHLMAALFAPLLSGWLGHDPYEQVAPRTVTPPTPPEREHPLGTDALGRDQLSRLIHGSRISLQVGLAAEAIALLVGVAVGAAAGYAGGKLDSLLMRATDIVLAFPGPLLALAIIAAVPEPEHAPLLRHLPHPSLAVIFLVLGLIGWAGIARLVRGEILRLRELEFASAARAIGAHGPRVVVLHLLPNALGPLLVAATLGIGGNILMEAWLSFLGVGARPPLPSWGIMVTEGQSHFLSKPWVCVAPGLAILTAVLGFNLLGDAIRDLVDPRRRGAPIGAPAGQTWGSA
jgi:ABC-type dipeptide/oligopeptide/nickel transport system permease subunit